MSYADIRRALNSPGIMILSSDFKLNPAKQNRIQLYYAPDFMVSFNMTVYGVRRVPASEAICAYART